MYFDWLTVATIWIPEYLKPDLKLKIFEFENVSTLDSEHGLNCSFLLLIGSYTKKIYIKMYKCFVKLVLKPIYYFYCI